MNEGSSFHTSSSYENALAKQETNSLCPDSSADLNPQQSISIILRSEQLYKRFSRVTFERRHTGQSNNAEASRRKKAAEISGSRETMEQEKETSRRNMQRSGVIAKRNEEDQGRFGVLFGKPCCLGRGFSNRGLAVMWLPRLTSTKDLVQVCMQIDLSLFVGFDQAQFCVALVLGMANNLLSAGFSLWGLLPTGHVFYL
ncbi:hypothetical protein F2Q68_00038285 [Brassica cretica]|uniref:Uncharacterized protein n=2 Tax=Brassica cretica TaxID=69181 RepID=A0A8S9MLZ9_BRACR|nr:hypothetical protein F2Q68_00038285 [Brassica cretica]KAF3496927.1 hypothetical protein DY000_02051878 [Brassica cretica]